MLNSVHVNFGAINSHILCRQRILKISIICNQYLKCYQRGKPISHWFSIVVIIFQIFLQEILRKSITVSNKNNKIRFRPLIAALQMTVATGQLHSTEEFLLLLVVCIYECSWCNLLLPEFIYTCCNICLSHNIKKSIGWMITLFEFRFDLLPMIVGGC